MSHPYAVSMHTEGDIALARRALGAHIRALRLERGWSQYEFSDMIQMNRSYLIDVEKGRRNVAFDNLYKIAQGLGVTLPELVSFEGPLGTDATPLVSAR